MNRKTFLSTIIILTGTLFLSIFGIVAWIIMLLPMMIYPRMLPNPGPLIAGAIMKRFIRQMVNGKMEPVEFSMGEGVNFPMPGFMFPVPSTSEKDDSKRTS